MIEYVTEIIKIEKRQYVRTKTQNKPIKNTIMGKERKITAPEGCEIEKIELIDGVAVVTFREKDLQLPKTWEEFCEMYPIPIAFAKTKTDFDPLQGYLVPYHNRIVDAMHEFTQDRKTAEAVLALCQLIQLRECYNQGWKPDWKKSDEIKHIIQFDAEEIHCDTWIGVSASPLYFKSEELRDQFLENFRQLIEKLKPMYGIKEGGDNE